MEMDWYARRARPLDEILPWDHISAGVKKFLAKEYVHSYQGVVDDCREHCFSCGILGYFKEQRAGSTRRGVGVPATRPRQGSPAVNVVPVPLYFNDEMSPDRTGQFDRVPQRREEVRSASGCSRSSWSEIPPAQNVPGTLNVPGT